MAEVLVSNLLQKLADLALQKAITLYGVSDKVEDVKAQLIDIQCVLRDADSQRYTSKVAENWVKNVREVSFMIEDAIDTFLLNVESLSEKEHDAFRNSVKWVVKGPKKLIAMNSLDGAINKIQAKIKKINENKASFSTNDPGASSSSLGSAGSCEYMSTSVAPEDEKIDLVGFDKEKREIEELLLDQNTVKRSVVFIVGIGGLGKTTLAKKVYQSVKDKFDFYIRLTVTKVFNQPDLLKKILEKAGIETSNEDYHIIKVNKYLKDKKYFIVLDDVHSDDVWTGMRDALPDEGNGSRVLITTRKANIALKTAFKSVYQLGFLHREESIKLLFKKALPEENFNGKPYPPDLYEVAETAFNKCGGLPLALVVVGGQLSMRVPATNNAWKSVILTMNWLKEGKDCTEIFASSYEDLPVELRSCFMYFASFPEDHEYSAEFLTWLWIAEGFIPPSSDPGIMETISKKYLDELARRCMIQVSKKSLDGSISTFRVQNLLREFAINEAKEKDFINVISKKDDFTENNKSVRRVSSQLNEPVWDVSSSQEMKFTENINPNIRTLLLFGKVVPFSSRFTLLKVLVIFHYNSHDIRDPFPGLLIETLKKLLQLRCLAFIGCNFPWKVVLPIEHLHKLVTLVIRSCQDVVVPPRSLWGITTLRHVSVDRAYNFCDTLEGVSGPVDVPDLQILEEVKINKSGIEFLNMPNLFKLHLINESDSWDPIVTLLRKLQKLGFLTLQSMEIPLEILDMQNFPSYMCNLHTLRLKGRWQFEDGELTAKMFPKYLNMLTLESSHLDENSFQVLEKLTSLRILVLVMAYAGKKMVCSNQGFCELKHLTLDGLRLVELEIEEGAMPKLEHLEIRSCLKFKMVPDLQRLEKLKVLSLKSMPESFKSMINNEDNKYKIEKTRSINFDE
ncbi:hypothetical protein LUZ60_002272 [Juncus effusus]|nr:hypothetical protein LUZ60_002272 [Juncus effusus]